MKGEIVKVGTNMTIGFKVYTRELQEHEKSRFIEIEKMRSLERMGSKIIDELDEIFKEIKEFDPAMERYEAKLTIIKTEEYKKALKMLYGEDVDLKEVREVFEKLTK